MTPFEFGSKIAEMSPSSLHAFADIIGTMQYELTGIPPLVVKPDQFTVTHADPKDIALFHRYSLRVVWFTGPSAVGSGIKVDS